MSFRARPALRLVPVALLLAIVGAAETAHGQRPKAPNTFENLLAGADKVVPEGTLTRPLLVSASPEIDAAWKEYDAAVKAATEKLLKLIDAKRLRSKARRDEEQVAILDAAEEGIERRGVLPSAVDAGLRSERTAAAEAYRAAAAKLAKRYEAVIAELREDDKPADAGVVGEEWKLLAGQLAFETEPRIDSVWHHKLANGQEADITLYSDGSVNVPDGPDKWSLDGSKLTIRWKNPDAPGGEWVDTCELSQVGGSYTGKNQLGTKITGKRVPQ
jgi:hypothetical protein